MKAALGHALAGGLFGAGMGVSTIAKRYIDEEMAANKARALADIEFASKQRLEEYEQSDAVQSRRRTNRSAALIEEGKAKDAADLNRESNAALTAAIVGRKRAEIEGTSAAAAAAAGAKKLAEDEATSYELVPGQQRFRGGVKLGENARPTGPEAALTLDERGTKRDALDLKLPEAVKVQVQNVNDQLKELTKDINRGIADGTLSADPNDAKDPKTAKPYRAFQHLMGQRAALEMQRRSLLEPHMERAGVGGGGIGGGAGGRADPLGIRTGPADPIGMAQVEAVSDRQPVNVNVGGQKFAFDENGNRVAYQPTSLYDRKADEARNAAAPEASIVERVRKALSGRAGAEEMPQATTSEERALDQARAEARAAQDKLATYGSSQRQRDPAGFRRAQEEAKRAAAALREAEAAYTGALDMSSLRAVTRYATP